jgi:hypothetical protein
VACTNDDEPAGVTPADGNKVAAAPKYMSVNFVTSDGATTRAEDPGTPAESAIEEAAFLFFKGTSQVADPFVIKKGQNDAVTETGYEGYPKPWSDTTKAVVVLENPTDIPTSMVVLVNSGKTKDQLKGKTVAALQEEFGDFYTGKITEGKFVMANAVYNEGNANVIGAPVAADNVKDTPSAAEGKPVDVYVERVLAKVNVTSSVEDGTVVGTTGYDTNAKNITVKFNGWALVYENGQSFLIKNLKTAYADLPTAFSWNDAGNKRSYWADAYYPAQYTPKTGPAHSSITNKLDANTVLYTQENTKFQTWTDGAATNPTAVIVAATLSLEGATGDDKDLYKLGGVVLTKGDVETTLKNMDAAKKYYKADGTPVTEYTMVVDKKAQDNTLQDYQAKVYLKLATQDPVYVVVDGKIAPEPTPAADVDAALKAVGQIVELWTGGATYYYVPIKQHVKTTATGDKDVYGIVRNNFYKISITGISGLGTAVPDPAQPITPDKPEDSNYYIAAKILVQNWNLVEQNNVVLGQ